MDDEEECCNSGCNNCILDVRQKQLTLAHQQQQRGTSITNIFDDSYHRFRLIAITECTGNVRRLKFRFERDTDGSKGILFVPPTHHLMLRAPAKIITEASVAAKHDKETVGNFISRPYTPISCSSEDDSFEILVKFEPFGVMSAYLRDLRINDITEWKGVYGDFYWQPNPLRHKFLVCICQGVAIAPHFNLISSILADDSDETIVHLLACYRHLDHYLLRTELAAARSFWNFQSRIYLSQENCDECRANRVVNCACIRSRLKFGETVCNYRLDGTELKDFYGRLQSNAVLILFCGTNALAKLVEDSINELEINGNYYRIEWGKNEIRDLFAYDVFVVDFLFRDSFRFARSRPPRVSWLKSMIERLGFGGTETLSSRSRGGDGEECFGMCNLLNSFVGNSNALNFDERIASKEYWSGRWWWSVWWMST